MLNKHRHFAKDFLLDQNEIWYMYMVQFIHVKNYVGYELHIGP